VQNTGQMPSTYLKSKPREENSHRRKFQIKMHAEYLNLIGFLIEYLM